MRPGDRCQTVRPERVNLEEVLDRQIARGHHGQFRERRVHREAFRVVVHVELVGSDGRQGCVFDREADGQRTIADEVVSVRIGRLHGWTRAGGSFRHTRNRIGEGNAISHESGDDADRVPTAPPIGWPEGISSASPLQRVDLVRVEGRGEVHRGDPGGAPSIPAELAPDSSRATGDRLDQVEIHCRRVESTVVIAEREDARCISSVTTVGTAATVSARQRVHRARSHTRRPDDGGEQDRRRAAARTAVSAPTRGHAPISSEATMKD